MALNPYSQALEERLRKSREDLARFPLWLTTGSQKDYDEWFLGREPSREEKIRRITKLKSRK